ncbi:cysteine--tRNA ligase [Actinomadura livida]|uniref:Cysteine--tRNA ligase n=1 Tax=Actinomadura livida TaxID=79909 RepID=A0A7W7I9D1_9ACTN|nr:MULTISPECIES: cysteine--tRNA ligase [Actinomadura]MBB4772937.1 cysteinyl-tRNA synthetase [Actinomadura catellatispora]GGU13784.1 cysteine--tRNA ligase [Actinomadura livida]
MSLRLYDTGTRTVRTFEPLEEGRVGMYVCGATPQASPHIGHLRSGVIYDVLLRWLRASGYEVLFARNVTDIDDKIIAVSAEQGVPWFAVAEGNQRVFTQGYDTLGCLPPTIEPRATGHIPEMIVLMRRLIENGHAYAAGGDVYFDVKSWADEYGSLSNQRLENMRSAGDTPNEAAKRDPRDFALWKGAKPGEPAWETPWGPGRPGWHLECSAMATKYLGPTFDIHGGGVDLIFPHHENEIAQSRAAGDGFARYWLHNGLLTVDGEKMSKSVGNVVLLSDLLGKARPVEVRYYLVSAHYRSLMDYTDASLAEAVSAYQRIEGFVTRASELLGDVEPAAVPGGFADAMNDDLGVPQALAVLHETVREGNAALASGDRDAVRAHLADVRAMADVLGIDPLSPQWRRTGEEDLRPVVDALVAVALEQRQAARARKDYAAADAIRDGLAKAGILVEDTPQGPRWELKRD